MDAKKISELKGIIQDIENKILKAQHIVEELKAPISKLDTAIQEFIGNLNNTNIISDVPAIDTNGKRVVWSDEILSVLRKEKLKTLQIYEYFANIGKVPKKGNADWEKMYNNIRASIYNLQKNKKIRQVSNERGAEWEAL